MSLMRETFHRVHNNFVWTSDREAYGLWEHWRSWADEIERGETIRDDCDSFALTTVELLLRGGIAPSRLAVVCCLTETDTGHAVGRLDDYILDNRQVRPLYMMRVPYTWQSQMSMAERGVWRKLRAKR